MGKNQVCCLDHCTNSFTTFDGYVNGHAVKQIYIRVVVLQLNSGKQTKLGFSDYTIL